MSYTVICAPKNEALGPNEEKEFKFITTAGFISDDSERACAFSNKADAIEFRDGCRRGKHGAAYDFEIMKCLF